MNHPADKAKSRNTDSERKDLATCVHPSGKFIWGVHQPEYTVTNLRQNDGLSSLGQLEDGTPVMNHPNFPKGDLHLSNGRWVYEIPNAFPFKGTTYILKSWADENAKNPSMLRLEEAPEVSLTDCLAQSFPKGAGAGDAREKLFSNLPHPLKLALASTSTDPSDLEYLAENSCEFVHNPSTRRPEGLVYRRNNGGQSEPAIRDHALFDILSNNPHLPDDYKVAMVLRPGVQGGSPIVGEWADTSGSSHVFEYLRGNSYIPWGHFAANMAHDAVRYRIQDLQQADVNGMRHLYYQRIFVTLARKLGLPLPKGRATLSPSDLEALRDRIHHHLTDNPGAIANCTLWGWNFGADTAPSRYRLHASHQQIHQQYAMIPDRVNTDGNASESPPEPSIPAYACGNLVGDFIHRYRQETGQPFFDTYIRAIRSNSRTDGNPSGPQSLVVHEDEHVMLFVPKAQTSQWELQLMTLAPVGNILEAATPVREALDRAIWTAARTLGKMGIKMVTAIEYAKRFGTPDTGQRLLYAFLPRLPESPGAFSEAQLRWINGHYPEDFAKACRMNLP